MVLVMAKISDACPLMNLTMNRDALPGWIAAVAASLPTSAIAITVVAAWLLLGLIAKSALKRKAGKLDMPYVDFTDGGKRSMERYAQEGNALLTRGYQEYSKQGLPFSFFNSTNTSRPLAILPTKYLEEVRNASSSKLSFNEFLNKSQISADIGAPQVTDRIIHVVRQDLNKSLNDLIQPLHQACAKVVPRLIPPSQDWTSHPGFMALFQIVGRLMARVLVGSELWDDDEWHQVCMMYFGAGMIATARVRNGWYPTWLRWTSRFLDKYVIGIYLARRKGQKILKPVVQARVAEVKAKKDDNNSKSKLGDGIGWLAESYMNSGKSRPSPGDIMQDVAFLIAASVPSTASTCLSILYDLIDIDHANTLAEIREEISLVFSENGSTWTRRALGELRLLDSFMKESQRIHNLQFNTMQRMVLEPEGYTFKDGLHLPQGTPMVMPSRLLGLDPDLHREADKFDATRWKKKREEGDATKFHFASIHDDMLPWGSGPHACPGRFIAQDIIKLILVHFVTQYDIKCAEGDGHRPVDTPDHATFNPNMGAMLMFKER
ncbi:cytochrome P450 [Podospora australis]|uniref:Cytochrome P450 n=1 Tax=Podospora australis TaxID=1536484 RepID=A0AAN6WSX0_9PEZI|nr:cytochrome P450 [Podospora australis]